MKSAGLAILRVHSLNRLRARRAELERLLSKNELEMAKVQKLAFAALPDGFAISLDKDEPWFVVDEEGQRLS